MRECKYEFIRCTKVVLPEPAMPMVMITTGLSFVDEGLEAFKGGCVDEDDIF